MYLIQFCYVSLLIFSIIYLLKIFNADDIGNT